MKHKIILNADDYGAMDGIDQGIIKGIENGVVNSVSTFVNFPDSKERINHLMNLNNIKGKFRLGLHLSITSGYGDNPAFYKSLMVKNTNKFAIKKSINTKIVQLDELKVCLWEQIDKLADWLGGYENIDHINMHHNLWNLHPGFFPVQLEIHRELREKGYNIPLRSPMTWSNSGLPYYKYGVKILPTKKEALKNAKHLLTPWTGIAGQLLKIFRNSQSDDAQRQVNKYKNEGIKHAFCFVDQYYGQPYKKNLERILEHHKEGEVIELMLHLFDRDYKKENKRGINRKYLPSRMRELETMISYFNKEAYELVNHGDA